MKDIDHDLSDYEEEPVNANTNKEKSIQKEMDVQQTAYRLNYERVLHKIVRHTEEGRTPESMFDIVESFQKSNENLFKHYYERAAMIDKLGGLSQNELKGMLQDSPTKFKRMMRKLEKLLKKHDIRLNSTGEVDWSRC